MRPQSLGQLVLALVWVVGGVTSLAAAEVSDAWSKLDGRWTLWVENPDPKEPAPRIPATASSGWGREITITTEPERVTIERHQFVALDVQPPMLFAYALGGAESRNVVDMGRGPQEQVARAERKGETLVIVSRHAAGTDLETEITQRFSIDGEGTLIVDTARTTRGVSSSTKARYRRPPPPNPGSS